MLGQDDGVSVAGRLFPTSTYDAWGEYLIIKAVHFHDRQFVGQHFIVLSDEIEFVLVDVGNEREALYTVPVSLLQVREHLAGHTAPRSSVFIHQIDFRYPFVVLEAFIYSAYKSADV